MQVKSHIEDSFAIKAVLAGLLNTKFQIRVEAPFYVEFSHSDSKRGCRGTQIRSEMTAHFQAIKKRCLKQLVKLKAAVAIYRKN